MYLLFSAVLLLAFIAALADIIMRDDAKHLPKMMWIFIVIVLPLVGSILWFAIGRPWPERPIQVRPAPGGSFEARPTVTAPRPSTTEEQLAALEREIEQAERIRELEARLHNRRVDGTGSTERLTETG